MLKETKRIPCPALDELGISKDIFLGKMQSLILIQKKLKRF